MQITKYIQYTKHCPKRKICPLHLREMQKLIEFVWFWTFSNTIRSFNMGFCNNSQCQSLNRKPYTERHYLGWIPVFGSDDLSPWDLNVFSPVILIFPSNLYFIADKYNTICLNAIPRASACHKRRQPQCTASEDSIE